MGYKTIDIKVLVDYTDQLIHNAISKKLRISEFTYHIDNKSLDARKKDNIHWLLRCTVVAKRLKGDVPPRIPTVDIYYNDLKEKVVVIGNGPAGFFSAMILQISGYDVTIVERGTDVDQRTKGIKDFESSGVFNSVSNYAFGEGGAGTFSDGKLTSRSKHISKERQFIISSYIKAGAPEEIAYMKHPHLGSDNLKKIVKNLRNEFIDYGGKVIFETEVIDMKITDGKVTEIETSTDFIQADHFIFAIGHSAYDTYRMLMKNGVQFKTKNFAIGSRVEHPQKLINLAQWGRESLPGVKAAEYRLASKGDGNSPVYTFCMCPGGKIVPAGAFKNSNIVNGMSNYQRNGEFANAACVAGVDPNVLLGKEASAEDILDWVEALELKFYEYSKEYKAPYCTIEDFINKKEPSTEIRSSYPMGLTPAPLWELFPKDIADSLREGLKDFAKKLKGFETGNIMGLESKTSSPIQVLREKNGLCSGFENLYMVGEGSGYTGGIISSAADGIKVAVELSLTPKNKFKIQF